MMGSKVGGISVDQVGEVADLRGLNDRLVARLTEKELEIGSLTRERDRLVKELRDVKQRARYR